MSAKASAHCWPSGVSRQSSTTSRALASSAASAAILHEICCRDDNDAFLYRCVQPATSQQAQNPLTREQTRLLSRIWKAKDPSTRTVDGGVRRIWISGEMPAWCFRSFEQAKARRSSPAGICSGYCLQRCNHGGKAGHEAPQLLQLPLQLADALRRSDSGSAENQRSPYDRPAQEPRKPSFRGSAPPQVPLRDSPAANSNTRPSGGNSR